MIFSAPLDVYKVQAPFLSIAHSKHVLIKSNLA